MREKPTKQINLTSYQPPTICLVTTVCLLKNSREQDKYGSWNQLEKVKEKVFSYSISSSIYLSGKMSWDGSQNHHKLSHMWSQGTLWTRYWLAAKNSIWEFTYWWSAISLWQFTYIEKASADSLMPDIQIILRIYQTLSCIWPMLQFKKLLITMMTNLVANGICAVWNFTSWADMGLKELMSVTNKSRIWS